jgi:hypothetical protein
MIIRGEGNHQSSIFQSPIEVFGRMEAQAFDNQSIDKCRARLPSFSPPQPIGDWKIDDW